MNWRVVFDTSTLVGAAIRPDSTPDEALQRAILSHEVCTSREMLDELERVLNLAKFDKYVSAQSRRLFVAKFSRDAHLHPVTASALEQVRGVCRDAKDDRLLALCLDARADMLVSSDQDLLVLHPWRGVAVLTPAQFLIQPNS